MTDWVNDLIVALVWLSLVVPLIATIYVLRIYSRDRRARAGLCQQCGYDLRGSGTCCSECGSALPLPVMTSPRWGPDAGEALRVAHVEARRACQGYLGTEHLLLGILALESHPVAMALADLGIDAALVHEVVDDAAHAPDDVAPVSAVSPAAERGMLRAHELRARRGGRHAGAAHLLYGLLGEPDNAATGVLGAELLEPARRAALEAIGAVGGPLPLAPTVGRG